MNDMDDFIELDGNKTNGIEINPCPRCGRASMKGVAQADSFFLPFAHFLVRCTDKRCKGYGWVILGIEDGQLVHISWSTHPGLVREGLGDKVTDPFRLQKSEIRQLPDLINHDFEQALGCFNEGFYDAAVSMARRALERSLIEKGAEVHKSRGLGDMISQLSKRGEIPSEAQSLCDEIRVYGNISAHPNEPMSEEDARLAIFFTDTVIAWLYGLIEPLTDTFS